MNPVPCTGLHPLRIFFLSFFAIKTVFLTSPCLRTKQPIQIAGEDDDGLTDYEAFDPAEVFIRVVEDDRDTWPL